jgi:hypothetical protein
VYHFDDDNDQGLTPILPGVSTIRRVRGLFRPSLTNSNVSDYNYKALLPFDQNALRMRLYDGSIYIDNELRTITFSADPGDTTETWGIDSYPRAPQVDEGDDLPILPGEEMPLLFVGMRAFAEEWKTGASGGWRPQYENKKAEYRGKLRIDKDIPRIDENLLFHGDSVVSPQ